MAYRRRRIAVIGSGISGMSAAWLLSQTHDVTMYERAAQAGGHSRTIRTAAGVAVDTGFIVYNEQTYPNLVALFRHLGVATQASDMSFAVSLDGGRREYSAADWRGMIAQPSNLVRPRFWAMLIDLLRFYRQAPRVAAGLEHDLLALDAFLKREKYSDGFVQDHLLPMAAAIWSVPAAEAGSYPAAAFIRFCENHGLLKLRDRPVWRTVTGGSAAYVAKLTAPYADRIRLGCGATRVVRAADHVVVHDSDGGSERYDDVVIATHAPQALALLEEPTEAEQALLGPIRTALNRVVMHRDPRLMPRRRAAWASWNYLSRTDGSLCVTYWMDRLQALPGPEQHFVTLNPPVEPAEILNEEWFSHPQFDAAAMRAQRMLWTLQGRRNTWFCGAWFGSGFHEDGLQSGLAVAEQLGGVRRPWAMPAAAPRIAMPPLSEAA
jgi:predicted NAD/FAD-binding protein